MTPQVSIVLTTFNVARYLHEALDSCLAQTCPDWELIIVDGGSTDGTLEVIARYDDLRFRLIHQTDNIGKLPGALNLGLDAARGEYLTWLQGDSRYHPQAVARMSACLTKNPGIGHVYADYWVMDETGQVLEVMTTCEPQAILAAKSDPCGVCFMIRRSVREVVGPHTVLAYPSQDYDYRLRIALHTASYHLNEPLYYWRRHAHSLSGTMSWHYLACTDIATRQRLGLSSERQARRDRAGVDIAYAFDRYRAGDYAPVPGLALAALRHAPELALNRGVWVILWRSVWLRATQAFETSKHA